MARANTATLDGLVVGYGTRDSLNPQDAVVHTLGRVRQHEVMVDHTNILEFAEDSLPVEGVIKAFTIPAGSTIVSCKLAVTDDVTDVTSLALGLKDTATGVQLHGGDDVLILDVDALEADLETGDTVIGPAQGVLLDPNGVVTSADAILSITVTGTPPTAGAFSVLVEYIEPIASQTSPDVIVGKI